MSTIYKRLLATALVSIYLAGMTSAQAAEPAQASANRATRSAKELADEQVDVMFLEVRAKKAKLLADIRKAETDGAQAPTPTAGAPGPGLSLQGPLPMGAGAAAGSVAPPAAAPSRGSDGPALVSITAYDGRFRAGFDVDGHVVQRSQGEAIDGGWTVSRITETSVELKRNKQVRVLRM